MAAARRLIAGVRAVALIATASVGLAALAQAQNATAPTTDAAAADPALAEAIAAGQKEYMKNCRTCHGSKGTAGVPLANNPKVVGNPGYLIWAVLTGPGYMPEFAPALSNEQIALIATYVGNSWGDSSGLVSPDDVQASR